MNIQLKDVIHFYLGCEIHVNGEELNYIMTGISYDDTNGKWWAYFENTELGYAMIDNCQPILRRLSNMTESDAIYMARLVAVYDEFKNIEYYPNQLGGHVVKWDYDTWSTDERVWSYKQFQFLLRNGYDLFELIESNQAIDKTKL